VPIFLSLRKTDDGHIGVLLIVDHATSWTEIYEVKGETTRIFATCLLKFILRFGAITEILSDNGPAFISEMFAELARLLNYTTLKLVIGTLRPMRAAKGRTRTRLSNENNVTKPAKRMARTNTIRTKRVKYTSNKATGFSAYKLLFARDYQLPIHVETLANSNGRSIK